MNNSNVRHRKGTIRPYLCGSAKLPAFLEEVFDATLHERHDLGAEGAQAELQVGNSVVVVEAGQLPPGTAPWVGATCVYVTDVDEVYRRAIALGAQSVAEPQDKPDGERHGGFRDEAGNTWWVSTCRDDQARSDMATIISASLFDTEPARLDTMLQSLAGESSDV